MSGMVRAKFSNALAITVNLPNYLGVVCRVSNRLPNKRVYPSKLPYISHCYASVVMPMSTIGVSGAT